MDVRVEFIGVLQNSDRNFEQQRTPALGWQG